MLDDLPQPVKDYIIDQANKEYEKQPYRFSVSELVYCLRKAYYRRIAPTPIDLDKAWWFFRGRLFHEALGKLFDKKEIAVTHRIKGTPIVISGRLDIMHEGTIIEFKTVSSLKFTTMAKPQHRLQATFYAYCEGLEKVKIIYMDLNSARSFDVEVDEKNIDYLEDLAKELYRALETLSPPIPKNKEKWECSYCEYSDNCAFKEDK